MLKISSLLIILGIHSTLFFHLFVASFFKWWKYFQNKIILWIALFQKTIITQISDDTKHEICWVKWNGIMKLYFTVTYMCVCGCVLMIFEKVFSACFSQSMINAPFLSYQESVIYEEIQTWDINQYINNTQPHCKKINDTKVFTSSSFFHREKFIYFTSNVYGSNYMLPLFNYKTLIFLKRLEE